MPRVNIYIRNEDEDAWNAIADKPGWLHEYLNMPKATKDVSGGQDAPKCPICGNYHFEWDKKHIIDRWHDTDESTIIPPEETA